MADQPRRPAWSRESAVIRLPGAVSARRTERAAKRSRPCLEIAALIFRTRGLAAFDGCQRAIGQEGNRVANEAYGSVRERKLEAARHYAELADEVERLSAVFGPNAFAVETLLPVRCLLSVPGNSPHYEEYGRRQVEAGHYPAVIRYTDHIAPLAAKLRAYVTEPGT